MGIILNPDLERRIAEKVASGEYGSADEVIERSLDALEGRDSPQSPPPSNGVASAEESVPIWKRVVHLGKSVSEQSWADVPADLAKNWEHYLYGAPRESE